MRPHSLTVSQCEIVASLSLAADIGMGQPSGQSLRTCLLALGVAREMSLGEHDAQDVFYLSLLRFVGCNAHADQDASVAGGNEMAFRRSMARVISGEPGEVASNIVRNLGAGLPPTTRVRLIAGAFAAGSKLARETITASCEVAQLIASRLGLGASLVRALGYSGEFWNGNGMPKGASAEAIPIAVRIVNVARDVDVLHRVGGRELAEEVLRKRRGRAYDPAVADAFRQHAWSIQKGIEEGSLWDRLIEADPATAISLSGDRLTAALECYADLSDIKCRFTRAHSPAVSVIARGAATNLGFNPVDAGLVGAAGLVQEIGKTGVPNGILDSSQPLTEEQRKSIRLSTYLTHMTLSSCQGLEAINALACAHQERLDGSGYHRGITGDQIPRGARILAAADAFKAMTSDRPWRAKFAPDEAARRLSSDVREGKLSHDAVDAVLAAAGHADRLPRQTWPAGLSDREVDVLRLISLGSTNREVAKKLYISPKTVGRHIENIYGKIGVSTRPAATLFAMQHRLLT